MLPNPKPDVFVRKPDRYGPVFQRHPRGPDFLSVAFAELLELERRMVRVVLQQRELLIRPSANVGRQCAIILPEIGVCAVVIVRAKEVVCFRICDQPGRD